MPADQRCQGHQKENMHSALASARSVPESIRLWATTCTKERVAAFPAKFQQARPRPRRHPANRHVGHRLLQVGPVPDQQRRGDLREPHPARISAASRDDRSFCSGRPLGTRQSASATRSHERRENPPEVRATASLSIRESSPRLAAPHERHAGRESRAAAHIRLGDERYGVALRAPGVVPLPVLPQALGSRSLAHGRGLPDATDSGQHPVRAGRQEVHAVQFLRVAARHVRRGLSHRRSAPGLLVREALGARLGRHRILAGIVSHCAARLTDPGGESCRNKQAKESVCHGCSYGVQTNQEPTDIFQLVSARAKRSLGQRRAPKLRNNYLRKFSQRSGCHAITGESRRSRSQRRRRSGPGAVACIGFVSFCEPARMHCRTCPSGTALPPETVGSPESPSVPGILQRTCEQLRLHGHARHLGRPTYRKWVAIRGSGASTPAWHVPRRRSTRQLRPRRLPTALAKTRPVNARRLDSSRDDL